ncbi:putative hyalin-like isoform X2 [Apostichopus japonicus]|uniref:Putative hyalin-like isoform X2 n=1 Tax=Stichopus japonicus TaxID=307972 RepID=A0A2G8KH47_STIJA|nr:putative hyalin-like isoform X2 [Apostichopus japonicus]
MYFYDLEPEAICPWRAVSATATGIDTTVIWKNPFSLRSGDGDDQTDFFSGGQFKVGVSKVMSHNNQSLCRFSVIVEDLNPPTITSCSDDINVQLEFEEEFVAVQWQVPTALDLETRELDIQATHTPGDIFSEGVTTVNYTFTDLSNNQATCNFHINITRGYDPNDSEPPKIINCPNATRIVSIDVPQSGYEIICATAVDDSGFPVEVTSSHQPGDQLQLGTTTITYEFTDVVGNSASCSFKINIVGMIYEGSGAGGGTRYFKVSAD